MTNRLILIIAIVLSLYANGVQAQRPPFCAPYAPYIEVVLALHELGEARVGWGMYGKAPGQHLIETFAMPDMDKSSWTVLIVQPNGLACVLIYGTQWQIYEYVDPRGITVEELPRP